MTRRLILAAVSVTATVIAAIEWWRSRHPAPLPVPSGFVEAVVYQGPHTIRMSPSMLAGLPQEIANGDVLLVDQDLAADLVSLPSAHWRYA